MTTATMKCNERIEGSYSLLRELSLEGKERIEATITICRHFKSHSWKNKEVEPIRSGQTVLEALHDLNRSIKNTT